MEKQNADTAAKQPDNTEREQAAPPAPFVPSIDTPGEDATGTC